MAIVGATSSFPNSENCGRLLNTERGEPSLEPVPGDAAKGIGTFTSYPINFSSAGMNLWLQPRVERGVPLPTRLSWPRDAEGTAAEGTDCKLGQIDRKSAAEESHSHTIPGPRVKDGKGRWNKRGGGREKHRGGLCARGPTDPTMKSNARRLAVLLATSVPRRSSLGKFYRW